jgi:hypothetical protein
VTAVAESALLGNQTPRFSSVPPYSVSLGDDAVAFAAKAGLFLDPWQQMVLRESMGMAPGGKWSAPQVGLLVPRQNGKGSVLEALELFHLFVLNTKLIIHSAHKFDTSQEHFLRMRTLIEGNPDLARHVAATPTANGKEAIILRNGNRLKFKARTISGAGRGFSSDLLILDEAMLLPEQALDAMMPTLTARPIGGWPRPNPPPTCPTSPRACGHSGGFAPPEGKSWTPLSARPRRQPRSINPSPRTFPRLLLGSFAQRA